MNRIIPFDYRSHEVRSLMIGNEPWFVAKDVCIALELGDTHKAVDRLDEDERNLIPVTDSLGREQQTFVVNESGLYSLTLGSKKPEAKPFKRWVTHDVLPTLRKTGTYSISGYAPKATSLGEIASFLKITRSIMKDNGQLPEKISEMAETVCKQFNISLPDNFVRHNPFQQTSLFNITNNIILPPYVKSKPAKGR